MKTISEKEIPEEVKEYMAIVAGTGGMMGLELYQKCKAIEEKYPKWFPWEHKYKSIPQEVHKAYFEEKHSNYNSKIECKGGLASHLEDNKPFTINTKTTFKEMMEEWHKSIMKIEEKRLKILEEDKALWDKHYKKYGLEFRY